MCIGSDIVAKDRILRPSKNIDFTSGNIVKALIMFAIPIFMGDVLQNMYQSVDSLVVGNYVGENALAAVSVCGTLSRLIVGFFNGMSVGASVVVARAFGSKDEHELTSSINVTFMFSVLLGTALSLIGIILTPVLIRLCGVNDDVYGEAVQYLRIYLAGTLFTIVYNVSAGILRACGDSRSTFTILLISSILNIFLDLFFVSVIPMGVAGVALSTVIAQFISVLVACHRIRRLNNTFRIISVKEFLHNKQTIYSIMKIGMPSGLQGSLISVSNLFVWRHISSFDSAAAIAGIGIAQRLDRFAALPAKSFGLAVTTFISQNEGAKNHGRAKQGIISSILLAAGTTLVVSVVIYTFAGDLTVLFNDSPEIISISTAMMRTIIPFYATMVIREIMLGVLRGYGNTRVPMILSITGMIAVRQVYLYFALRISHTLKVVYYCYPLAWGATALMLLVYYLVLRAKKGNRI